MCKSAIEEDISSMYPNNKWTLDEFPSTQPLPIHVEINVKGKLDGDTERIKSRGLPEVSSRPAVGTNVRLITLFCISHQ